MTWPWRKRAEQELEDELAFHLERAAAKTGSARSAEALLGGSEAIKEECRAERRGAALGDFVRDLRVGWRLLRRSPGFAVTSVLTLALAIGANTAAFSLLDSVLRIQAPFAHADRIVALVTLDGQGQPEIGNPLWSGDFADYRAHTQALGVTAGWTYASANLAAPSGTAHVGVMRVTRGFFQVWGQAAERGRTFLPSESDADRAREVILSDQTWRTALGGSAVVGQPMVLDGERYTVIGVMPPRFGRLIFGAGAWTALTLTPAQLSAYTRATAVTLSVAARLRPGATLAEARGELATLARQQARRYPEERDAGVTAVPISSYMRDQAGGEQAEIFLLGVTGIILLVGCASVAGLMMERGAARAPEMATRRALGAGRGRLLRQLLTESLLIAATAAAGGLLLAWPALRWLNLSLLARVGRAARLDLPVLAFTAAVAMAAATLAGLAPALQASGRRMGRQRLRSVLVAGEIALAMMGLAASTTLVLAIWQEMHSKIGYDPTDVLGAQVELTGMPYATPAERQVFAQRLEAAAAALPGGAGAALVSPAAMSWDQPAVEVRGAARKLDTPVKVWAVTPSYFDLLKIPWLAGRGFGTADVAGAAPVAVISATAARRLFPQYASAVGQYLRLDRGGEPAGWRRVVGVVGDVRVYGGEAQGDCVNVYEPLLQTGPPDLGVLVKAAAPGAELAAPLRRMVRRLDANLPLFDTRPIRGMGAQDTGGDKYLGELLCTLAAVVLLSAGIGLYGLVAFAAARRRREIAIRIALGAPRASAIRLLLAGGLRLAGIGLGLGLPLAWLDSYLLAGMFGPDISARSPLIFGASTGLLAMVVALACVIPARRTARIPPLAVLKEP